MKTRSPTVKSESPKGERAKPSAKKPSSFYMKQMRAGLAAAGYVKHETWVLPKTEACSSKWSNSYANRFWLALSCRRIT
jgi:hypothetical protein